MKKTRFFAQRTPPSAELSQPVTYFQLPWASVASTLRPETVARYLS